MERRLRSHPHFHIWASPFESPGDGRLQGTSLNLSFWPPNLGRRRPGIVAFLVYAERVVRDQPFIGIDCNKCPSVQSEGASFQERVRGSKMRLKSYGSYLFQGGAMCFGLITFVKVMKDKSPHSSDPVILRLIQLYQFPSNRPLLGCHSTCLGFRQATSSDFSGATGSWKMAKFKAYLGVLLPTPTACKRSKSGSRKFSESRGP